MSAGIPLPEPVRTTVHDSIAGAVGHTPIVRLMRMFAGTGVDVLAKLEYLNPLGSAKDRVARHVLEQSLARGLVRAGGRVVESSSGNLGIALAALGRIHDLRVTCVVDPTVCPANLAILRSLDADVQMVQEPDASSDVLGSRLRRVQEILDEDPDALWVNQYANELCWQAHYDTTAAEVLEQVPGRLDVLVVAVSTTATLVGLSRRLREHWPAMRVVAVDAVGSVVFGGQGQRRRLPGLGSSRQSQLISRSEVDDVQYVSETEAMGGCRSLLRAEGLLAGASSGAVAVAVQRMVPSLDPGTSVLVLLPDRGERYLDLVFAAPPPAMAPQG